MWPHYEQGQSVYLPVCHYWFISTHHVTEGVAQEDGVTVEQGPVSTPLTRLPGNKQVIDYFHTSPFSTSEPCQVSISHFTSISAIKVQVPLALRSVRAKRGTSWIKYPLLWITIPSASRKQKKRKWNTHKKTPFTVSQTNGHIQYHTQETLCSFLWQTRTTVRFCSKTSEEMWGNRWAKKKKRARCFIITANKEMTTYLFNQPLAAEWKKENDRKERKLNSLLFLVYCSCQH